MSLVTDGTTATISVDSANVFLVNGTPYTITIRAVNAVAPGAASGPKTATPATVPDAPTLTSAIGGDESIELAWVAPTFDGGSAITDYEYSTDSGTTYLSLGTVIPATINVDSTSVSLTNGTEYTIIIRAVNAINPSVASNSISATPVAP